MPKCSDTSRAKCEDAIRNIFDDLDIPVHRRHWKRPPKKCGISASPKQIDFEIKQEFPRLYVVEQDAYTKCTGDVGSMDFVVYAQGKCLAWVECKNQDTGGSVTDKYALTMQHVENLEEGASFLVVLQGDGIPVSYRNKYKRDALAYRDGKGLHCIGKPKDLWVCDLVEAKTWLKLRFGMSNPSSDGLVENND